MSSSFAMHVSSTGKADVLPAAPELDSESLYIWHHFFQPTEEELKKLPGEYGLHPLAIEDCMDDDQIPKMESFPKNTHLIFNTFNYHNEDIHAEEVNLFIGDKFIITVTRSERLNESIITLTKKMSESKNGLWRNGPGWLLHYIIDKIVDEKMDALEALEDETDSIEDLLLSRTDDIDFAKIQKLRYAFQLLRKSLFHEREILNRIIHDDHDFIDNKAAYLYRDVYDHVVRLYELTESCRETVKNLIELHLAMANNQMAIASENTNKTIRRLTFITTIFMPLTLIAGIGGMSEYSMMTGPENWRIAYLILVIILTIIGILSYRWLQGRDKES